MTAHEGATRHLAELIHTTIADQIPEPVLKEARRALLNYLAVALGGCRDRTIEAAIRTLGRFGTAGEAGLIGRHERFGMLDAAAINAMSANVFDFCDTHFPTIVHPTAPVAPVLGALSGSRTISGREFLLAFVLGVETECRIANAISPWHYARGWHITSTCGVFGAAAATAKILKLEVEPIVWALGNASAQAGGLVETLGSSSKSVSVGNAARNGLLSAFLAAEGFEGPAQPLEGPRGFLRVFGEAADMTALATGTSGGWQILRNACKPYPCGVVLNPVIDACLDLVADGRVTAERLQRIERIELTGHPLLRQRTDRPDIRSGRQSQVSAQHAVAITLSRRKAGIAEFGDDAVNDPAVQALGRRVRFVDDDTMSVDSATIRIEFENSPAISHTVAVARGSLARPMSDAEIAQKLRDLCRFSQSTVDPERLIDAVWSIDHAPDVGAVFALAMPA